MEDIYINVEYNKPDKSNIHNRKSTDQTGLRSSEGRLYAVILCLGLLSVFLLAGLIGLGVTYAELSTVKTNLTERLQISDNELSSLTEERDLLKVNLTEMTKELNRLKRTCPAGWMTFNRVCYFLSTASGSWEKGREDCRDRGADLVVISSTMEQYTAPIGFHCIGLRGIPPLRETPKGLCGLGNVTRASINKATFLNYFIEEKTMAWIGLTDSVSEGTWMWIDGAPLSLKYWRKGQPDNNGGHSREEDCAHIKSGGTDLKNWNDLSCSTNLKWICQKMV